MLRPLLSGAAAGALMLLGVIALAPKLGVSLLSSRPPPLYAATPDWRTFDLDAYLAWRATCDWKKLDKLGGPVDGFTTLTLEQRHSEPIDDFLDHQYEQYNQSRAFVLEHGPWRCQQDVEGDADSFRFIDRMGPFTTRGGEDWVSIWFSDIGGLNSLPPETPLFLTGGAFLPMTNFHDGETPEVVPRADDVPMPHPPINPHHWHMNTGPNWDYRNEGDQYVLYQVQPDYASYPNAQPPYLIPNLILIPIPDSSLSMSPFPSLSLPPTPSLMLFQVHSDNSQCVGHEGLGCYGFELPEGYGMPVLKDNTGKHMLFTTGSWLDVRAFNSPPKHHWLEFYGKVSKRKPRFAVDTFAIVGVPLPMGWQLTLPHEEYLKKRKEKKWSEHFNEMLFMVPKSSPSVFWASISGPPVTAAGDKCASINSLRWHEHGRFVPLSSWVYVGVESSGSPSCLSRLCISLWCSLL
ncbi:MAG: hypothetical protein SGPRY_003593 [Prymnesium sp.]